MKGIETGAIALDTTVLKHFDQCLGCMGCVTACPSGVRYDLLIEDTRAQIDAAVTREPLERGLRAMLFATFPYPERLRVLGVALALYARTGLQALVRASGALRLLPKRLQALEMLTPSVDPAQLFARLAPFTAARGTKRGTVALVAGCVQRAFFGSVNEATIRVLSAEGYDVVVPDGQGCCGALSVHVGRHDEATRFAERLVRAFGDLSGYDAVIINAAGCGSTLKEYGELLRDPRAERFAEKVRDVSEFLAEVGTVAERRPLPMRVAYHDACHLSHAQRIRAQPRSLLRGIPELELVEIPAGEQCCGSAGVYNILEPDSAAEIGARKADNVASTRATVLASANPGCTLQIRSQLEKRGISLTYAHPIELLDAALA